MANLTDRYSDNWKAFRASYYLNVDVPPREYKEVCDEGFVMRLDCSDDARFFCEVNREECDCCIKYIDNCPYFTGSDIFDPKQPIPYVGSISDSGLLEVRWDREM